MIIVLAKTESDLGRRLVHASIKKESHQCHCLLPGCTDQIMEDAKKKKDDWTQRLQNLEVESLLSLRDTLLARGSMLTMSSADIKDIIRDIKSTVSLEK